MDPQIGNSMAQSVWAIHTAVEIQKSNLLHESRIHEDPPVVTWPQPGRSRKPKFGGAQRQKFGGRLMIQVWRYRPVWSLFASLMHIISYNYVIQFWRYPPCLWHHIYTFWLGYFNLFLQCAWSSPHFAGFPRSPQVFSVLFPNFSQTVPKVFHFFPSFPHFSSILTTSSLHFCRTSRPFLGRHWNFARPRLRISATARPAGRRMLRRSWGPSRSLGSLGSSSGGTSWACRPVQKRNRTIGSIGVPSAKLT